MIRKAFLVLERFAMILLSMAVSLEDTSSLMAATGFVAPLLHRTSPKSPFYNHRATHEDIITENQGLSAEREHYFTRRHETDFGSLNGMAPINRDMIMIYYIGTPPVKVYAIADTGSSLIWVQCKPCNVCFDQTTPFFDPAQSLTYQTIYCKSKECASIRKTICGKKSPPKCLYNIHYADNSSSRGIISRDDFSFVGNASSSFTNEQTLFGCGMANVDTGHNGVAGIVGLENTSYSLVGQVQNGSYFSYCKGDNPEGYIRFGSSALLRGNDILLNTDSFGRYQLPLGGVAVGNLGAVNIPGKIFEMQPRNPRSGVIIDSGTPYTRLHPVAFDAVIDQIKTEMDVRGEGYSARGWALCYNGNTNPTISQGLMPEVQFAFLDFELSLPVQNVWTEKDNRGNVCFTILRSKSNLTVIGAEQLKNFNVGFDLKNNLLYMEEQQAC